MQRRHRRARQHHAKEAGEDSQAPDLRTVQGQVGNKNLRHRRNRCAQSSAASEKRSSLPERNRRETIRRRRDNTQLEHDRKNCRDSTEEVLRRHVKCLFEGDLEGIVSDYSTEGVVYTEWTAEEPRPDSGILSCGLFNVAAHRVKDGESGRRQQRRSTRALSQKFGRSVCKLRPWRLSVRPAQRSSTVHPCPEPDAIRTASMRDCPQRTRTGPRESGMSRRSTNDRGRSGSCRRRTHRQCRCRA